MDSRELYLLVNETRLALRKAIEEAQTLERTYYKHYETLDFAGPITSDLRIVFDSLSKIETEIAQRRDTTQ